MSLSITPKQLGRAIHDDDVKSREKKKEQANKLLSFMC